MVLENSVYKKLRSKNKKYDSGFECKDSTRKTVEGSIAEDTMTPFEKQCTTQPGPIVDHMPYWYLKNIKSLKDKVDAGLA